MKVARRSLPPEQRTPRPWKQPPPRPIVPPPSVMHPTVLLLLRQLLDHSGARLSRIGPWLRITADPGAIPRPMWAAIALHAAELWRFSGPADPWDEPPDHPDTCPACGGTHWRRDGEAWACDRCQPAPRFVARPTVKAEPTARKVYPWEVKAG